MNIRTGWIIFLTYNVVTAEATYGSDDDSQEDPVDGSGFGSGYVPADGGRWWDAEFILPLQFGMRGSDLMTHSEIVQKLKNAVMITAVRVGGGGGESVAGALVEASADDVTTDDQWVQVKRARVLVPEGVRPDELKLQLSRQKIAVLFDEGEITENTSKPPISMKKSQSNFLLRNPALLAAIISAVIAALFCVILCTVFIVYRMRRKDEGSFELETKLNSHPGGGGQQWKGPMDLPPDRYMFANPQREIYA